MIDTLSTKPRERRAWPRAVLFDLDGTLIDSAPDIAAAVNELLARSGRGPLTLAAVTSMIGNGVEKLVERAIAATGDALGPQALEREQMAMIDIYAKHLTGLTVLMPGVREALDALHGDGILLGLVTNKPQRFIETVLDHFGLSSLFGVVIGGDAGVAKKPAPDMLLAAVEQFGVAPQRCGHGRRQRGRRRCGAGCGHPGRHRARRLHQRAGRTARRRCRHRRHDRAGRGAGPAQAARLSLPTCPRRAPAPDAGPA